ncbi:MAG TPA: cytochrome c3 family protein [Ignavibacteria bacterium]|jgi:predicted CXXCH cytochrome family protein
MIGNEKILRFGILFVFLLFNTIYSSAQEIESKDQCFNCHSILDGKLKTPADLYKGDIHFRKGVACSACHGGISTEEDQDKSMSKSEGFIGVPGGLQVSKICAKCHSKEFETLSKSVHGQSSTGQGLIINNCITCHGVHNIIPVKSPGSKVNGKNIVNTCASCHNNAALMRNYNPGLKVDQLEKYKTSVHGQKVFSGDSKPANCASCHGNHDIQKVKDPSSKVYVTNIPSTCNKCHGDANYMKEYKIPTDQYEKYKHSVHGVALLEKGDLNAPTCNKCHGDHGAAPPEVESVSKVCGTCHVLNSQMFQESPHKSAFDSKKYHECSVCHNNHDISSPTDEMLGNGEKSVCVKCHQNDKGLRSAITMRKMIDSLINDVDVANYFINAAEQKGMDVSDVKFESNDIKKVLITSRTITHTSDIEKYINTINEGFKITNKAKISGKEAVDEYYFRRLGLGVSTVFITILCITLYLKLKKIEKKQQKT